MENLKGVVKICEILNVGWKQRLSKVVLLFCREKQLFDSIDLIDKTCHEEIP